MAARRAEETSGIRARGVKLECRAGEDRHIIGANPPVFLRGQGLRWRHW